MSLESWFDCALLCFPWSHILVSFSADLRDDPVAAYDRAWRHSLTVPREIWLGFMSRSFGWLGMSSWAVSTLDKALEKIEKGTWWYYIQWWIDEENILYTMIHAILFDDDDDVMVPFTDLDMMSCIMRWRWYDRLYCRSLTSRTLHL